jgi:hypothetical protein
MALHDCSKGVLSDMEIVGKIPLTAQPAIVASYSPTSSYHADLDKMRFASRISKKQALNIEKTHKLLHAQSKFYYSLTNAKVQKRQSPAEQLSPTFLQSLHQIIDQSTPTENNKYTP